MEGNPLGELIARGEGGYGSFNRGRAGDTHGATIDFSQMTLRDLQAWQSLRPGNPERIFAVGKYQIIPDTMRETIEKMGLDQDLRLTPELQERMFSDYLIVGKRPDIHGYIVGKPGVTLHDAQEAVAAEWASVADPDTGRSKYGSVGNNRASISAESVGLILQEMRAEYATSIGRGVSAVDAWQEVTRLSASERVASTVQASGPRRESVHSAASDGVLMRGEHGIQVSHLQTSLRQLGYRDSTGREIVIDGDFGDRTEQAVKAFQQAQGLVDVDGIVGRQTIEALRKAVEAPLLSDAAHPNHAMYQQALRGVQQLPPDSFKNDTERSNAAATLVFEARVSGMRQIDHVVLSTNGSGLFAVQGRLDDPAHSRIYVDRAQAAAQPVERSTEQLRQDTAIQQQVQTQSQVHVQQQQLEHRGVALGIRP